ncbi:MAG: RidA family protein [Sphingobacteriales bacterium]|nr:MAG: RidA family protein [Sphingobacteriales bacterium]
MKRINISSGAVWEDIVGYSRAVRVGNIIKVAGTTAVDGDEIQFPNQPFEQTLFILEKIEAALKQAGASMEDVVCTRIYVCNIHAHWEDIGRAHGQFFGKIKPAATMVQVSALIDPSLVVEIEAEAIIQP